VQIAAQQPQHGDVFVHRGSQRSLHQWEGVCFYISGLLKKYVAVSRLGI
jgi:hypothetical protein